MYKKLAILCFVLFAIAAVAYYFRRRWDPPVLEDSVPDAVATASDYGAFADVAPYRQFTLPRAEDLAFDAWETVELSFELKPADLADPFDLKVALELRSPSGDRLVVPAFYYGCHPSFEGCEVGMVRFYVREPGRWEYSIRTSDALHSGAILVGQPQGTAPGPLILQPGERWFKDERNDSYPYLQAKFLDREDEDLSPGPKGFENTHIYLSDDVSDEIRLAIIRRQREFGNRRINVYLSNYGDYGGLRVVPWQVNGGAADYARFDLRKMKVWDRRIKALLDAGLYVHFWFLADDSWGLVKIPEVLAEAQYRRFIRYAVARWSGCQAILWCLSLEYEENNRDPGMWNRMGRYLADVDPFGHPRSIHSQTCFDFTRADWATFQMFQLGFDEGHQRVHERTLTWMDGSNRPAFAEEFSEGIEDLEKRRETWAAVCAGATTGNGAFLKTLSVVMGQLTLRGMRNRDELAHSEKPVYVMANAEGDYLAYLPESHRFRLDLRGAGRPLRYRWFDPATGAELAAGDVAANGDAVEFLPPREGDGDILLLCSARR